MSDVVVILAEELVSYPGVAAEEADVAGLVDLVNQMVAEEWRNPVDPVPFWVKNIALKAASRALANPKGLVSWTRSIDDGSRTERASAAVENGLYLTGPETSRLRGRSRRSRMGTIRLRVG